MNFKRANQKINSNPQLKEIYFLTNIFTVSMLIRVIGVKHGFPLLTHPDEGFSLDPVLHMTRNHTLNTGYFNRPDQILSVINFFYLNAMSYLRFGDNFAVTFPLHQLNFYHYARLLISLLGSLIPIVAYKIGKEFKPNFAVPAALFFAFFPSYVLHSLYITPDIPLMLFTLIVIYFTIRYLTKNDEKSIYLAILFSAINTAEKYPGLISLAIVFLGIFIKSFEHPADPIKIKLWRTTKILLRAGLVFVIALFFVAPYLFFNYPKVVEALIFESRSTHLGADNLGWGGNLTFYVQAFASWINIFQILLIGFGIYALIKWRNKHTLILLYGALYWILISVLSLHWERWALPMYITPLFLMAIGITYLWELIKTVPRLKLILLTLLFLTFSQQFIRSVHIPVRMKFTDTRLIALNYCNQNGITPNNSLYEGYTPFLPGHPKFIFQENITENEDIHYVIVSSKMYERFYNEPARYEQEILFYENVRNTELLLAKYEPSPGATGTIEQMDDIGFYIKQRLQLTLNDRYTGPTIEIYQIVE